MFDWRIENNRATYYKGKRPEHSFALLESTNQNGEDYTAVLSLESTLASDNTLSAFEKFTKQLTDTQFSDILHKKCRACFNVFHHRDIGGEFNTCSKCQTKVDGFKSMLVVERSDSAVEGMFGSGLFISSLQHDDQMSLGQFSCSILRAKISSKDITIEDAFNDKPNVSSIEKNGDDIYTAIYGKEGRSPIPDGLIFLFYDIFLQKAAEQKLNKKINI